MIRKGFTLVELLVSLGIISLLSLMSFVAISGTTDRSKAAQLMANVNDIKRIALTYRADNGVWPPTFFPGINPNPFTTGTGLNPTPIRWKGPYIRQYPSSHPWRGRIGYVSSGTCSAVVVYDDTFGGVSNTNLLVPGNITATLDRRYDDNVNSTGSIVWSTTSSSVQACAQTLGEGEIGFIID